MVKYNIRCSTRLCFRTQFISYIINDLSDEISSSIFADDTSLFLKIEKKSYSSFQLNKDFERISNWVFQWKMLFNPDPVKQAIKICFSHNGTKQFTHHYSLTTVTSNQQIAKSIQSQFQTPSLTLTLFRMSFFGADHGWGRGGKKPPSLKSVTYILQR